MYDNKFITNCQRCLVLNKYNNALPNFDRETPPEGDDDVGDVNENEASILKMNKLAEPTFQPTNICEKMYKENQQNYNWL